MEKGVKVIAPNTPDMEAFLGAGYGGMTVAKANLIIAERKKDPALWPFEMVEKAEAFLAAYAAKAQVISTDVGWKRQEV